MTTVPVGTWRRARVREVLQQPPVPVPDFANKDHIHEGRELLTRVIASLARMAKGEGEHFIGHGHDGALTKPCFSWFEAVPR